MKLKDWKLYNNNKNWYKNILATFYVHPIFNLCNSEMFLVEESKKRNLLIWFSIIFKLTGS